MLRFAIAAGLVFSFTGCGMLGGAGGMMGGIGGPKVPPIYGPYGVKGDFIAINLGDRELRMQTAIEVPPDRGAVPVGIKAHGASFDAAAEQMTKAFTDLKKIGTAPNCGFKISHYNVPSKSGEQWKVSGSAEITVDVAGQDPDARITRANACFKALREYIAGLPKYDSGSPAGFDVSEAAIGPGEIWAVENLEKHRAALVTQADARLKAVAAADAKMWDHGDVQCTSAGIITVAQTNSHFVTLQLEMLCAVSAAETGSGPGKGRETPK